MESRQNLAITSFHSISVFKEWERAGANFLFLRLHHPRGTYTLICFRPRAFSHPRVARDKRFKWSEARTYRLISKSAPARLINKLLSADACERQRGRQTQGSIFRLCAVLRRRQELLAWRGNKIDHEHRPELTPGYRSEVAADSFIFWGQDENHLVIVNDVQ